MDRFNGLAGEISDLYYYSRNSAGIAEDLVSIEKVYIYPSHPTNNWAGNVVVSSAFGSIPVVPNMKSLTDTSIDFQEHGVKVGDYVEISSGPNVGKWKISQVFAHSLTIETSFIAAQVGLAYEVTLLQAILIPQRVATGSYRVQWLVPDTANGGYYYDKWVGIQKTSISMPYDEVLSLYVAKELPFFVSERDTDMTDRYTARVGSTAYLDMKFRDQPTYGARDPYQISELAVWRVDISAGPYPPVITSITGQTDAVDRFLLRDVNINFQTASPIPLRKYDTITISSPPALAGKYRFHYVDLAADPYGRAIRLLDILPAVAVGVNYTVDLCYWCDIAEISKVDVGEYMFPWGVPTDYVEGKYWDEWRYIPDAGDADQEFIRDYVNPLDYTVSDPLLIQVIANSLQLIDLGGGVYSIMKPSAILAVPNVLTTPKYIETLTNLYGPGNLGTVEFSLMYGGVDFWYNGSDWIVNSGYFQEGDTLWNPIVSHWRMYSDWVDSKRAINGTRYGTGVAFSPSNRGLFNGIDDYVQVLTSAVFAVEHEGFSITATIVTSAIVEQVIAMKAYRAAAANGGPGWVLGTTAGGNVYFRLGWNAEGSAMSEVLSTAIVNDGLEHTIFVTIGASSCAGCPNGDISIYIDGVLDSTFVGAGTPYLLLSTGYDIFMGVDFNAGAHDQLFYTGELAHVALFTGIPTVEEIRRAHADHVNDKHSMTLAQFNTHIREFLIADGDSIDVRTYLVSDGAQPVVVSENKLQWVQNVVYPSSRAVGDVYVRSRLYSMAPGPVNLCAIVGRVLGLDGRPRSGQKVTAWGYANPYSVGGNIVFPSQVEVLTDAGGYFMMTLPQGIGCWLSIPALNYKKKVTVPSVTRVNYLDLQDESEVR